MLQDKCHDKFQALHILNTRNIQNKTVKYLINSSKLKGAKQETLKYTQLRINNVTIKIDRMTNLKGRGQLLCKLLLGTLKNNLSKIRIRCENLPSLLKLLLHCPDLFNYCGQDSSLKSK